MARQQLLQHEVPDWDPMSADYYDPNFNNYAYGPGSRLDHCLQPCYPRVERQSAVFRLHVRCIPAKLSETGIRNVFLNFGEPLDIYRCPPGFGPGWAFVSYATHREAELAIRELNNRPPYYFKVQFARSAAEKERIHKERENKEMMKRVLDLEPYKVHSEGKPFVPFKRGIGRGRGIPLPQQMMVDRCCPGKYEQCIFHNDKTLEEEDADEDMGYFSPYVPGVYDETNRMIMQQKMNLTFNSSTGSCWVSMGRGYFPVSERPVGRDSVIKMKKYTKEEELMFAESVEQMYERECDGWYEYGQKVDMAGKSGSCVSCDRMTTQCCQRCGEWYCTRECQVEDWPRHKIYCIPMPSLSDISKLHGSQQSDASTHYSAVKQRHEQRLGRSDLHQANGQNRHSFSEYVGNSDSRTKSHFGREEESKEDSKEKQFKQNNHDQQNRNTGCVNNRNKYLNTHFTDIKRGRPEPQNNFSEDQTGSPEAERCRVDERSHVGRQMESGGNNLLASYNKISPQLQQESQVANVSVKTGPVQKIVPLAESMTDIAVVTRDHLPDKAASAVVKKMKTPDYKVSSAANRMETLNLRDSTTFGCYKCEELPKDRFTKVKITVTVGPMEYCVQLVDSEPNVVHVMRVLFEEPELLPCELQVGAMCAALYEGFWYRGKVTSVKPELKVLYIDFGNEEVCSPNDVKTLPSSIMDIPALGLRIKLADGTSEKYNMLKVDDTLSVKAVGEASNGAILVHVEGELYELTTVPVQNEAPLANSAQQKSATAEKTASKISASSALLSRIAANCPLPQLKQNLKIPIKGHTRSSAVDGLKVGVQGGGQFRQQLIGEDFSVTIVYPEMKEKFAKLFGDLHRACESTPVDGNYKPSVGDMVGAFAKVGNAEKGDAWNRAYILSVGSSGYRVNFCDVGHVGTVETVKKLPEDLALIPEFAATCSVVSFTKPQEKFWPLESNQFLFTVTSVDEDQKTVMCILRSATDEELCKAVLKPWVPTVEDEGLKSIQVKNNDIVVLQVFFDQKSLYIRPVSGSSKDVFSQLNQDVGLHCIKALDLDRMPAKNEMVACRFLADGNYYRAKVLDVGKETVKVTYVDFGNQDCVTKDKLKPLPESLKRIPCMVVKVGLKDVEDKPMTAETSHLLSSLIGEEVEMKLILTGSHRDGVHLILPDGSSLNDRVNTLLQPEWKKAMAAGQNPTECKVFMESDIKYLELPVGHTIDFLVLHKMDSVNLMGCEAAGNILSYVHTTMSEEMNHYCNSAPEKSYVPRYSELCIARFEDGVWYRAMCIEERAAKENNIIFLDFGNMAYIDKTNIRKMVPDYVKTPVVAVLCVLEGLENSTEKLKQRVCELVQVNKMYKARVVSCSGPGIYSIELPHVTEVLIKENLLSSEK